jgi:hypothetical protein
MACLETLSRGANMVNENGQWGETNNKKSKLSQIIGNQIEVLSF